MKKFIAAILAITTLFSCALPVYADEPPTGNVVIRFTDEELKDDPALAIEKALKLAKGNDDIDLEITVPEGKYKMSRGLHIYGNTKLVFEGETKLIREFEEGSMLKAGSQNDVNTGYDGYQNITVIGGIWDNRYVDTTCIMRFAHCKNVLLKDMTIKNDRNSHHMEIGAANNMTLDNVTFSGYQRTKNTTGEAVQIDPVHHGEHFKAYQLLDDTPCKNITVKNCTFKNVFAGVGSRAGVVGSYFSNIRIVNNYFSNITDKAILAFNYVDSEISGNVVDGASIGVFVEEFPQGHYSSKWYMPYDTNKPIRIRYNTNIKINNNKINLTRNAGYNRSCGIGVYGGVMSGSSVYKNASYSVNNIKICFNKITLNNSASYGIDLKYVNKSTVSSNTVSENYSARSNVSGMSFYHCKNNNVASNRIKGSLQFGINMSAGSTVKTLYNNKISGVKNCGLALSGGAKFVANTTNLYCGTAEINGDVVKKPKSKGKLKVQRKKKKTTVKWTQCKYASGYFLYRKTSKNGKYKLYKTFKDNKKVSFAENTKNKCYYLIAPYKYRGGTILIGGKVSAK